MNAIGSGLERVDDPYPVESYRFVYSLELEEVLDVPNNTVIVSAHPNYENSPIAGAVIGSVINIFV